LFLRLEMRSRHSKVQRSIPGFSHVKVGGGVVEVDVEVVAEVVAPVVEVEVEVVVTTVVVVGVGFEQELLQIWARARWLRDLSFFVHAVHSPERSRKLSFRHFCILLLRSR
jgi:hypothetical protein